MDDNKLDELSRRLAKQRLSRRQMLVTILAMVSAACSSKAKKTEASTSVSAPTVFLPPITKLPGNEFEGSCEDVTRWRETVGVQDDNEAHPFFSGWTTNYFAYSFDLIPRRENTGAICISTGVAVRFTAHPKSFRLEWKPTGNPSAACLAEKDRWEKTVEAHEGHHVKDAEAKAAAYTAKWTQGQNYEACGSTEQAVFDKLRSQIKKDLDAEIKRMKDELTNESELWHKTEEGKPLGDPNCEMCGPSTPPGGPGTTASSPRYLYCRDTGRCYPYYPYPASADLCDAACIKTGPNHVPCIPSHGSTGDLCPN